jgi:hypothetical protein
MPSTAAHGAFSVPVLNVSEAGDAAVCGLFRAVYGLGVKLKIIVLTILAMVVTRGEPCE